MCFCGPVVFYGAVWLYNSHAAECHVMAMCWSVIVVCYVIIIGAVLISSLITIGFSYATLQVLEDIDDETTVTVEEVCSPLPLYSALVTSTVLLGGIGLVFACIGIAFIIFAIRRVYLWITGQA